MKNKAIICDLDGTLCLFPGQPPYDRDYSKDIPNEAVLHVIKTYQENGVNIIFTSGRNEKHRSQTVEWLRKHGIGLTFLYMRKDEDYRKDSVVKKEMYEDHIEKLFDIIFVLDDRNQVVDLWRSLGLTCFQVAEGDF